MFSVSIMSFYRLISSSLLSDSFSEHWCQLGEAIKIQLGNEKISQPK